MEIGIDVSSNTGARGMELMMNISITSGDVLMLNVLMKRIVVKDCAVHNIATFLSLKRIFLNYSYKSNDNLFFFILFLPP